MAPMPGAPEPAGGAIAATRHRPRIGAAESETGTAATTVVCATRSGSCGTPLTETGSEAAAAPVAAVRKQRESAR